jgi:hypothetical protein
LVMGDRDMDLQEQIQTTEVRVLRVENGLSLVEWIEPDGLIERFWVKQEMIESQVGNLAQVKSPRRGVPFGDNLTAGYELKLSYRDVERELRSRKIWKYADVLANPNGVVQAIQAALGVDLAAFLNDARQQTRR